MRFSTFWTVVVSLGIISNSGMGSDQILMNAILELPSEDTLTLNPENIIKECSELLRDEGKHEAETVIKAIRARADAYIRLRRWEEALKDADELCRRQSRSADPIYFRALVLVYANKLDDALAVVNEALKLDPKNARGLAVAANVYAARRQLNDAMKWADQGLALDNKCAECYAVRSIVYWHKGEDAKCLEDINRYLELRPLGAAFETDRPYYVKGMALLGLDRPQDALSSFLMARRLKPDSFPSIWGLCSTYGRLEKWHLTLLLGKEWTRVKPYDPYGYVMCAKAKAMIGNHKDAIDIIGEVITRWGTHDPQLLVSAGDVYSSLGHYRLALEYVNKALDADSDRLTAIMLKAELLSACPNATLRDGKMALTLALKADRAETSSRRKAETAMLIAQAYAECGDFEKAVQYARKAIEQAGTAGFQRYKLLQKLCMFERKMPYRLSVEKRKDVPMKSKSSRP